MSTLLQIANSALIKLGGRTISALSDSNKEAQTVSARINEDRKTVLRQCPAQFAIKRVKLTTLGATPAYGYANSFALPADFLRVFELNEGDEAYELEGGSILSDSTEIRLRYVYDYQLSDFPDPVWNEALACYLAWDVSYQITQSGELRDRLWLDWTNHLKNTRFIRATELASKAVEANDFLDARLTRGRYPRDPMT